MIPARMASVRFPGKPLVDLGGKPMVQWVVEAVQRSGIGDEVVVATPDPIIVDSVESFGARAVLTSAHHPSGTDRIAEVAEHIPAEVYINVQG
ncbi:MAG: NTP transferase domain-containing protein, partial [Fimbriimonadaceae bacterium]|nr:NTP transferase domain-containing protein [Fimbriimonadaceae bacterium]